MWQGYVGEIASSSGPCPALHVSHQSLKLRCHHVSRRLDKVGVISDHLCLTGLLLSAGLDFRESVDSEVVKRSISSFSSIVKEQLEEKVSLDTFAGSFIPVKRQRNFSKLEFVYESMFHH